MAGNKKIYTLDEYQKDKNSLPGINWSGVPTPDTSWTAYGQMDQAGMGVKKAKAALPGYTAGAMQKRKQILSSINLNKMPQQTTEQTEQTNTQQGAGTSGSVQQPEQGGALTQSQLTTEDTMRMMEDAMASLAEWGNRKFVYNAKESPLYTILQQQAEKEARLASGRAYSRAVANTGGFGSSYATLAAEEAGRQVMEGLDDQQLALYQAAREEFEAERQSRVDWYNTAKQLHSDRMALDELQAIEAAAKASGMNTDTYNLLQTAVAEGWYDGTNKATVRNRLETMALGNPNINVDAIMTQLEGGQKAQMTDLVSGLSINPTLSGAAEIMAQAKVNGTEAEVLPEVSKQIGQAFTEAITDISGAYNLLGIEPAKWNEMFASYEDPDERAAAQKAYVLEAAGQAKKNGILSGEAYVKMLSDTTTDVLNNIETGGFNKPASEAAEIVIGLQNYKDLGYLNETEYEQLIQSVADRVDIEKYLDEQTKAVTFKLSDEAIDYVIKHMKYVTDNELSEETKKGLKNALGVATTLSAMAISTAIPIIGLGGLIIGALWNTIGDVSGAKKRFAVTGDQWYALAEIMEHQKVTEE